MSDLKCVSRLVEYLLEHAGDLDEADINTVAQVKRDLARVTKRVMKRRGDA